MEANTCQRYKVQDLKSPPECFESAWPIPPSHFGRLLVSRCGLTLVFCQSCLCTTILFFKCTGLPRALISIKTGQNFAFLEIGPPRGKRGGWN